VYLHVSIVFRKRANLLPGKTLRRHVWWRLAANSHQARWEAGQGRWETRNTLVTNRGSPVSHHFLWSSRVRPCKGLLWAVLQIPYRPLRGAASFSHVHWHKSCGASLQSQVQLRPTSTHCLYVPWRLATGRLPLARA
jgi:hypothetical protein